MQPHLILLLKCIFRFIIEDQKRWWQQFISKTKDTRSAQESCRCCSAHLGCGSSIWSNGGGRSLPAKGSMHCAAPLLMWNGETMRVAKEPSWRWWCCCVWKDYWVESLSGRRVREHVRFAMGRLPEMATDSPFCHNTMDWGHHLVCLLNCCEHCMGSLHAWPHNTMTPIHVMRTSKCYQKERCLRGCHFEQHCQRQVKCAFWPLDFTYLRKYTTAPVLTFSSPFLIR